MNELYTKVKQSLDGLAIPPLQDIVNKFLPDRGILQVQLTPKQLDDINPVWRISYCGCSVAAAVVRASIFNIHSAPFIRSVLEFDTFWLDLKSYNLVSGTRTFTIVYQGEPEIVQID